MKKATKVRIEFVAGDGKTTVLKKKLELLEGEVIDATVMNVRALRKFYEEQIEDAKKSGVLLSLHLKATMMKISDPIMFGHAVSVFYKDVFEKHAAVFKELGVNPNNGLGDLYAKIKKLPEAKRAEIEADIQAVYKNRPALAMVDSDKGITNLHAPNDIIVDASMPVVVRDSGKMWGPDGKLHDTKAMIPDRCYATTYRTIIEDCKKNGAFDPATIGSRPERRSHGAKGGGVRFPRQDVPGAGKRNDPRRRRFRGDPAGAEGGRRGHLPDVPGERSPDPGLGQACRQKGEGDRSARRFLAGQEQGARRADHRKGQQVSEGSRYEGPGVPYPGPDRGDEIHAGTGSGPGKIRSPSPGTRCAII